ncbi:MAG: hypothetical protein H6Q15_732 [Bacteroidetes bacterium]|nr:hypothetical protein [Bacteroidota bacterium]
MKLKLSKKKEEVLDIVISALIVTFVVSPDMDWFKEVSLKLYIISSILALISFVISVSKDIYKGNKYQKYYFLGLFLVVLIIQIIVGKVMLFGIIINFFCFVSESARVGYVNWKEKEAEKERKRLE